MTPTKRAPKLPKKLPLFIVKAMWDSTALLLKIEAKNEDVALEKAWQRISKFEGGSACINIIIIGYR